MLWHLSLPAKHRLSFFLLLYYFKEREGRVGTSAPLLCPVNFILQRLPPCSTRVLHLPCVWHLGLGCVSAPREQASQGFSSSSFFFGHASRHAGSSFSSSSDKGWNPGPLQWKCGVLTTGLPEKSSSLSCSVGDLGLIPGLRRSPGKGKGYPFQYSGLENSMDCIVHGVAKSQTWLSNCHFL